LAPLDFDLAHLYFTKLKDSLSKEEFISLEYDFEHELKKSKFTDEIVKGGSSAEDLIKLQPGDKN
jgi:hypothetical protein